MPNLAAVLKEEIRRLARREARAELAGVKRASSQHRRDIAALKRELTAARRTIGILESELRGKQRGVASDTAATEGKRWSARGLSAHRQRLGLSAKDYGALVGVSGQTIYLWERGARRPRPTQLAAALSIRDLGKRAALARLAQDSSSTRRGAGRTGRRRAAPSVAPTKTALARLLREHGGNVSAVARELGKARNQIHRWCRQHSLRPAQYR